MGHVTANATKSFQANVAAYYGDIFSRGMDIRKTILTNRIVNFGQLDSQFLHRPRDKFVRSARPQLRPQLGQADLIQLDFFNRR